MLLAVYGEERGNGWASPGKPALRCMSSPINCMISVWTASIIYGYNAASGLAIRRRISKNHKLLRGAPPVDPWEDPEKLVAALSHHDESAWRHFLTEYGPLIRSILGRFALDPATREDLFQEACLSVLRSANSLRDPRRFTSWIYSITHRLAIDARRRARPAASLDEVSEDRFQTADQDREPGFVREIEDFELAARTIDGIRSLDVRCRNLLTALYLNDPPHSYQKISRTLGLPLGSIGPTRARCLQKLRESVFPLSNPPP